MKYEFIGPAFTPKNREIGWEECLNLYVESVESSTGKVAKILVGTPGTAVAYPPFPNGQTPRTLYKSSTNVLYAVAGSTLYRFTDDESEVPTAVATIPSVGRCVLTDDGRYLSIADGSGLYVHDMSNPFSGVTTPVTGVIPSHVVFVKGYTVCNNLYRDPSVPMPPTDNLMYYSELYNASDWSTTNDPTAMQFFAAEGNVDPVISLERVGDVLWSFGSNSYECYSTGGSANKPFVQVGGSTTDIGCAARYSTAVIGETVYWLGTTRHGGLSVYKSQGYDAVRISDYAIENMISSIDFVDAIGWSYEENGHKFYVLTIKNSKVTVVYDETEGEWHRRASRIAGSDVMTAWEPIYATSKGITTYVGSNLSPRIVKLSSNTYTEWDGRLIKRTRSGPILWDDQKTVRHNAFVLDLSTGVGLIQTGVGFNPQVMMRYSDDAGYTWSNEEWEPMGLRGDYTARVKFNRLGVATKRIYEVNITEPCKVVLVGASIDIGTGGRY